MWGKNSANATDSGAVSVHGTNPQNLVEKILRSKIYNHPYWREHCFGLTAESLVDKAMNLEAVGGTFGGVREPTKFIQLTLKMLQIQPEKEIVIEFIKNDDYKYVRALGAFYLRLTGKPAEVYQYLEPLYNDYRKLRRRLADGSYTLMRMDEFVDECLREDHVNDIVMPHLPKRLALEQSGQLAGPRRSALQSEFDAIEAAERARAEAETAAAEAAARTAREREREDRPRRPDPMPRGERRDDDDRSRREPRRSSRSDRSASRSPRRHGHRDRRQRSRSPDRRHSRREQGDDRREPHTRGPRRGGRDDDSRSPPRGAAALRHGRRHIHPTPPTPPTRHTRGRHRERAGRLDDKHARGLAQLSVAGPGGDR